MLVPVRTGLAQAAEPHRPAAAMLEMPSSPLTCVCEQWQNQHSLVRGSVGSAAGTHAMHHTSTELLRRLCVGHRRLSVPDGLNALAVVLHKRIGEWLSAISPSHSPHIRGSACTARDLEHRTSPRLFIQPKPSLEQKGGCASSALLAAMAPWWQEGGDLTDGQPDA